MSYVRPYSLQPKELKLTALDSWLKHVFSLIRDNSILNNRATVTTPSSYLNVSDCDLESPSQSLSQRITYYFEALVPKQLQEEVFHHGAQMLRKEEFALHCCAGLLDMFAPYFQLFWKPSHKFLNIPSIADSFDRVTVLEDLISKAGAGASDQHGTPEVAKFRLFDHSLSLEESYLMKRALRSLAHSNLKVLVLWKVADDAMLSIIGANCHQLESLDVWR